MSATFVFNYFPASERQKGCLANVTIEVVTDGKVLVRSRCWQMRESRNGPFLAAPEYKSNRPNPKGRGYTAYTQIWPKTYDQAGNVTVDTSEEYKSFQNQGLASYNTWVQSNGGNSPQVQSISPQVNTQRVVETIPTLPAGWTTAIDTQHNKRYFTDAQGTIYFEGDPRLASLLAGNIATPVATPAPAPAGGGAPDPFDAFTNPGR